MLKQRIIIYSKDIQLLTGKTDRAARTMLKKIKSENGKGKNQVVTVKELCEYLGLSEEIVLLVLF